MHFLELAYCILLVSDRLPVTLACEQSTPSPGTSTIDGFSLGHSGSVVEENAVAPVVSPAPKTVSRTKKEEVVIQEPLTAAEQEMLDEADDWVEDADGNFVKKGE